MLHESPSHSVLPPSTGRVLPERQPPTRPPHWAMLKQLLEQSAAKLTRNAHHARWPATADRPSKITLWRWLESAWLGGQLDREGLGTTKDPFRYGLPACQAAVPKDG